MRQNDIPITRAIPYVNTVNIAIFSAYNAVLSVFPLYIVLLHMLLFSLLSYINTYITSTILFHPYSFPFNYSNYRINPNFPIQPPLCFIPLYKIILISGV